MSRKTPTQSLISATDIREDILSQNLSLFFGSGATFESRETRDRGTAYLINSSSGIAATPAIIESLRAASRRADENDKALYKTRSSEKTTYPPRRPDLYPAKSELRHHASDPQPAFGPRGTSAVASPYGVQPRDNVPRTPSHYDNPMNERRKDYGLFAENEEDDSPQQSSQSVRPPRHDSIQQTAQAAGPKHPSVVVDSQGGSGAVPIRKPYAIGQDHYQETSESHYRSPSQQRADTEARHKPEVPQARHPLLPPQASYLDPNRTEQPYGGSYSAPTTYLPGHPKTQGDFKDFMDWQEYRRQREEYERRKQREEYERQKQREEYERQKQREEYERLKHEEYERLKREEYERQKQREEYERQKQREEYERERPPEAQRVAVGKFDEGHETPPPGYSEAESRHLKPRQPSPGTYGQKRGHPQGRRPGYHS